MFLQRRPISALHRRTEPPLQDTFTISLECPFHTTLLTLLTIFSIPLESIRFPISSLEDTVFTAGYLGTRRDDLALYQWNSSSSLSENKVPVLPIQTYRMAKTLRRFSSDKVSLDPRCSCNSPKDLSRYCCLFLSETRRGKRQRGWPSEPLVSKRFSSMLGNKNLNVSDSSSLRGYGTNCWKYSFPRVYIHEWARVKGEGRKGWRQIVCRMEACPHSFPFICLFLPLCMRHRLF